MKDLAAHGEGIILFHRVLPLLIRQRLDNAMRAADDAFYFSDGSAYLQAPIPQGPGNLIEPRSFAANPSEIAQTVYRVASVQPMRWYTLYYPSTYQKLLGERKFGAASKMGELWPSDFKLDRLEFTVWFRRKPARKICERFVESIRRWLASVEMRGVHGEGPIRAVEPDVTFCGRRANIYLDASQTGPFTLNSLILLALEFGCQEAVIEDAVFNQDDPAMLAIMIESMRKSFDDAGQHFDEEAWRIKNRGGSGEEIRILISAAAL